MAEVQGDAASHKAAGRKRRYRWRPGILREVAACAPGCALLRAAFGTHVILERERYIHPSPEAVELACERFTSLKSETTPHKFPTMTGRCWSHALSGLVSVCPGGEIGRRKGLKICRRPFRPECHPRSPDVPHGMNIAPNGRAQSSA